jgi:hypothetical protein
MWLVRKTDKTTSSVAETVAREVAEAAALAQIDGQDRLTNPRLNPAVRPLADTLLVDQHRHALKAAHGRVLRRYRVEHRRADDAERALMLILEAREASSPARAVLALHRGRRAFMAVSLAASLALSYGAASGVAELAKKLDSPWQAGWVAEIGMTGLSTAVILYRSHLSRYAATEELTEQQKKAARRQDKILWTLMITPLLASITANAFGAGPVGIACSVGATAFSLFSHLIASMSASALHTQAAKVTAEDERELHAAAVGDDLFTVPTPNTHPVATSEPMAIESGEHTPVPTPEPTPMSSGGHKDGHNASDHDAVPSGAPTSDHSSVPTTVATGREAVKPTPTPVPTEDVPTPVATPEPMTTGGEETTAGTTSAAAPAPASETAAKPKAKRRTRDEIRAALQKALKEHYDNGGGEPKVQPLAEKVGVNRRIVRELLDEMNVRPMIRKAVGQ